MSRPINFKGFEILPIDNQFRACDDDGFEEKNIKYIYYGYRSKNNNSKSKKYIFGFIQLMYHPEIICYKVENGLVYKNPLFPDNFTSTYSNQPIITEHNLPQQVFVN